MKEYFYLSDKDQHGPFTIEELKTKGLTNDTLVWFDGIENWKKLKDIPELCENIQIKKMPPPIPNEQANIHSTNTQSNFGTTSKRTITILIAWCSFHLFALIMSYSRVPLFNKKGTPKTSEFWPFVDFQEKYWGYRGGLSVDEAELESLTRFNGIFAQYDWSEFSVYIGASIILFSIIKISNKKL